MKIDFFKMLELLSQGTLHDFVPMSNAHLSKREAIVYDDTQSVSDGKYPVLLNGVGNCDCCCETGFPYTVRAVVNKPKRCVEVRACGETIVVENGDWNFIDLM